MMTATTVANNLDSIKAIVNMRVFGNPELLTSLTCNGGIVAANYCIAKECFLLSNNSANVLIELESKKIITLPWCEPATLSVVVTSS